jgi:hypothetical protein
MKCKAIELGAEREVAVASMNRITKGLIDM